MSSANDDVGSFQVTFEVSPIRWRLSALVSCSSLQADVYVFVPTAGDGISVKVRKDHGKVATAEGERSSLVGFIIKIFQRSRTSMLLSRKVPRIVSWRLGRQSWSGSSLSPTLQVFLISSET